MDWEFHGRLNTASSKMRYATIIGHFAAYPDRRRFQTIFVLRFTAANILCRYFGELLHTAVETFYRKTAEISNQLRHACRAMAAYGAWLKFRLTIFGTCSWYDDWFSLRDDFRQPDLVAPPAAATISVHYPVARLAFSPQNAELRRHMATPRITQIYYGA